MAISTTMIVIFGYAIWHFSLWRALIQYFQRVSPTDTSVYIRLSLTPFVPKDHTPSRLFQVRHTQVNPMTVLTHIVETRYGLQIGARCAPFVLFLMYFLCEPSVLPLPPGIATRERILMLAYISSRRVSNRLALGPCTWRS